MYCYVYFLIETKIINIILCESINLKFIKMANNKFTIQINSRAGLSKAAQQKLQSAINNTVKSEIAKIDLKGSKFKFKKPPILPGIWVDIVDKIKIPR